MLLIDGVYINNGGGKRLLDLLVKEITKKNLDVMYLFDKRILNEYKHLKLSNAKFISASLLQRHIFYLKNKKKITSVIAFANIPPTIKLKCKVYTYFHNILFLSKKSSKNKLNSIPILLKAKLIKLFKKNTNKWIVQSDYVKKELQRELDVESKDILVLPIFDNNFSTILKNKGSIIKNELKFIYVSDGHFYKNHIKLINAFSEYNKIYPNSTLTLTIGENYIEIKNKIKEALSNGINIIDKGILTIDKLRIEYDNADICIFPSLFESFGLGLIEASLFNIPICASDLPYVYEVINPNSVFDPNSEKSILNSLLSANKFSNFTPELLCTNKIDSLINLISK